MDALFEGAGARLPRQAPATGPDRPPNPRREAIVWAAKAVFLERGFKYATMDEVASQAGTTKRTVYNHFTNKEALFTAVVGLACDLFLEKLDRPDPASPDIEGELVRFCARFLLLLTWADALALQRIVLAEVAQFPDFGRDLFRSAFARAEDVLADYVRRRQGAGATPIEDPGLAARRLLAAATASPHLRALFGVDPPTPDPPAVVDSAQVDTEPIRAAVRDFLAVPGRRALFIDEGGAAAD